MILKYGKRLLFKRGVTVSISLLYECTLNCSYCSLKMGGKIHPKDTVIHGSDYWIDYIDNFRKFNQVNDIFFRIHAYKITTFLLKNKTIDN